MTAPTGLRPCGFGELPGWEEDAQHLAFRAFRRSALHARQRQYRTGSFRIVAASFANAFAAALDRGIASSAEARAFFELHFRPFRVPAEDGGHGFVTGFYEPVLPASSRRTGRFTVPLMRRPDDLVEIDDTDRPPSLDPYFVFGRKSAGGVGEYFDRAAIENGALEDRGLEIAWLEDRVDAFFVHVQGAATLRMDDGTARRVTYAAKSGHRFTGPGGVLVELGELSRDKVTAQAVRAWLRAHPDRIDEILQRNRSYIFFRETEVGDPEAGPVAAAKVQLEPGRSIAVDRAFHTFATPIWVDSPSLSAFGAAPLRRLMIAQDTGSAIVGPARGDLFAGSGDEAFGIAGVIRHPAAFFALVPAPLAESWGA